MTEDFEPRGTVSAGDTGEFLAVGITGDAGRLDPGDTGEFLISPADTAELQPIPAGDTAELPAVQASEPSDAQPQQAAGASVDVEAGQVPAGNVVPVVSAADEDDRESDATAAMAALATDEGARSVDDPDIVNPPMPLPLDDEDDPQVDAVDEIEAAAALAAGEPTDPHAAPEIDNLELAALIANDASPSETVPFTPVKADPKPPKPAPDRISGTAKGVGALAWGSRSDVGCVRDHNEDSFVVRFPLFAVADGMGGHEAGEIASSIAVSSLAAEAPDTLDDEALGSAVEAANMAVIQGATNGLGRPGMGTTCTAVVINGTTMAVAHVGDSRCYLLHAGKLVRVTHDHSYVEELVAAGEITAEEARVHPNRSIITRALGNDPKMTADHFTVDVCQGDRVLLCSDGLSSMVTDDVIEEGLVSSPSPQSCADALVEAALAAGGHDNVTCVVVDVKNDGNSARELKRRVRNLAAAVVTIAVIVAAVFGLLTFVAHNTWYLTDSNGVVVLHRGIKGMPAVLGLDEVREVTAIETAQLSDAVSRRLAVGITFGSEEEARARLDDYQAQVEAGTGAQGQESVAATSAKGA